MFLYCRDDAGQVKSTHISPFTSYINECLEGLDHPHHRRVADRRLMQVLDQVEEQSCAPSFPPTFNPKVYRDIWEHTVSQKNLNCGKKDERKKKVRHVISAIAGISALTALTHITVFHKDICNMSQHIHDIVGIMTV